MVELFMKLLPVAVNVKLLLPAVIVAGDIELSTGAAGLCTVKFTADDVPAPVVVTVILLVPAAAIFAAGTTAVKEVALT